MIVGFVSGQKLALQSSFVVADSVDYLTASFSFMTSDWTGADAWAHFVKGAESYEIQLKDGKIAKDKHLNLSAGEWQVSLHGTIGNTRITTQAVGFTVQPSGVKDGEVFPGVPLEPLEQVSQTAGAAMALAEDNKRRLDEGGGGGGGVSQEYVDTKDAETLSAAKAYANTQADESLMDAMGYTDSQINLIPAWAKEPVKPTYSASEVGALPDDTVIPNVPKWALEPDKPTYTATEVGALPSSTKIPTKTSDLENDSGFLTQHQSLADYAKKSELPTKTSELQNDSGFLTEHQSLESYAKKTDLPTKTSELTNDSGFLTAPYGYETEATDSHELKANVFCEFTGNHANINITLAPADGYAEYNFSFVSAPSGCNLSIPVSVVWDGGKAPTLEASKKYEVSIFGNVAIISQGAVIA